MRRGASAVAEARVPVQRLGDHVLATLLFLPPLLGHVLVHHALALLQVCNVRGRRYRGQREAEPPALHQQPQREKPEADAGARISGKKLVRTSAAFDVRPSADSHRGGSTQHWDGGELRKAAYSSYEIRFHPLVIRSEYPIILPLRLLHTHYFHVWTNFLNRCQTQWENSNEEVQSRAVMLQRQKLSSSYTQGRKKVTSGRGRISAIRDLSPVAELGTQMDQRLSHIHKFVYIWFGCQQSSFDMLVIQLRMHRCIQ